VDACEVLDVVGSGVVLEVGGSSVVLEVVGFAMLLDVGACVASVTEVWFVHGTGHEAQWHVSTVKLTCFASCCIGLLVTSKEKL
jgi:hypothetical protein